MECFKSVGLFSHSGRTSERKKWDVQASNNNKLKLDVIVCSYYEEGYSLSLIFWLFHSQAPWWVRVSWVACVAQSLGLGPKHFKSNQSRREGCGKGQIQQREWQPSVNLTWRAGRWEKTAFSLCRGLLALREGSQ